MTTSTQMTISFPYKRSLGPVMGAFMTALANRHLLGIRSGGRVLCPPREWDPDTAADLSVDDLVEVGPGGTVESWSWVSNPSAAHPLDRPFAFALVRLDGADTTLVHVVDAGSIDAMSTGMRVVPRWRAERKGHITDLEAFVAAGDAGAQTSGATGGEHDSEHDNGHETADEIAPVAMMDYLASVTYTLPITKNEIRARQATQEGRFLGLRCPTCNRVYLGGRGYCPVDALELGEAHEIDLPQRGTLANYTIILPVQYPGQTETEPFARIHVLLDGGEAVVAYQNLIEVPVSEIRIGMRLQAIWGDQPQSSGWNAVDLEGWIPTGEPDVVDPNLVNRIC